MSRHATQSDFTTWANRASKMTINMLNHAIAECVAVGEDRGQRDPVAGEFFSDQAGAYVDELRRRLRKGRV